jgi:hypothetical protein
MGWITEELFQLILLSGSPCILDVFENKVLRKLSVLKKNGIREYLVITRRGASLVMQIFQCG